VRVRTTGHGISAAVRRLRGFIGCLPFPFLMHRNGLFEAELAAAVASIVGLIVTSALLPETKGKSLEAI
jgi:MFS transporter, PHS family, inorganic phosphate transporter